MNKFHQIPTDKFVPISHDNSYLFNHYDKVANFLAFKLNKNYKHLLAKPVQKGYEIDWFSVYDGLIDIKETNPGGSVAELAGYWEFMELIHAKVTEFKNSGDEDKKNWANLLGKVFNQQDNFIFSNGKDICIVWGWKFENTDLYKPNVGNGTRPISLEVDDPELIIPPLAVSDENSTESTGDEKEHVENNEEDDYVKRWELDNPEIEKPEDKLSERPGFKEFLKWFASHFWWLLWLLTFLIGIVFFLKAWAFGIN